MQIDTAGTYTLKYTAEDACGNITEVTREVVAEQISYRTVLYTDGTLIINEKSSDQATNEALHGVATNVYKAWGSRNTETTDIYRFQYVDDVLWYAVRDSVQAVEIGSRVKPTDLSYWFSNLRYCTSINLSLLDTSQATSMNCMFYYCLVLPSLDLSNFDTSQVTDMYGMFLDCRALTSLDLSSFNTANVTDMSSMFYRMRACPSLDLSNFDTSQVTTMESMFSDSRGFERIDLSSFDTSRVETMKNMFYDCRSLTSLDLGSFDTSAVTNTEAMFSDCGALTTIYVSSAFVVNQVTSSGSMFSSMSTNLVGGAGTVWSSSNPGDKTYARIDGGTSDPGYFTAVA